MSRGLSALEREITDLHTEFVASATRCFEAALRIGELLVQQKAALGHGSFGPWLATLPFSDRTARDYMRFYRHRDELKMANVADFGAARRLLASPFPLSDGEQAVIPMSEIIIGERFRRDLGDIARLAASIRRVGLLHSIPITPDGVLIDGERRLAACKLLGWTDVPVCVRDVDPILGYAASHMWRPYSPAAAVRMEDKIAAAAAGLGDIDGLAESIRTLGSLHTIPVKVISGLNDLMTLLAEREENTCRVPLPPAAAVRLENKITALLAAAPAKEMNA